MRWKRLQCCVPVFNDMLFCREALQRLSPVVRSRREQRVKNVKRPCFGRAAVATLIVDRSRCGRRLKWRQFAGFLYSCRLSAWGNRPRFRRIHYSLDARQRKDKEKKCFAVSVCRQPGCAHRTFPGRKFCRGRDFVLENARNLGAIDETPNLRCAHFFSLENLRWFFSAWRLQLWQHKRYWPVS